MMALLFNKKDTDLKLDRITFSYDKFTTKTSGDNVSFPFYSNISEEDKVNIWADIITKSIPYVPDHMPVYILEGFSQSVSAKIDAETDYVRVRDGEMDSMINIEGTARFRFAEPTRKLKTSGRFLSLVIPEDSADTIKCIFAALFKIKAKCMNFDWTDIKFPSFVIPDEGRPIYVIIRTRANFEEPDTNLKVITPTMRNIGFPHAKQIFS